MKEPPKNQGAAPTKAQATSSRHRLAITTVLVYCLLFVLVSLAFLVAYWLLAPPGEVLQIKNDPVPVRPNVVQAQGGQVILEIDYCKRNNAVGKVDRYLIGETGGAKILIASMDDETKRTCLKIDAPVPIPSHTPTDVYHIAYQITYHVNPLRTSFTVFRSRSFRVVNDKLGPGDAIPVPAP